VLVLLLFDHLHFFSVLFIPSITFFLFQFNYLVHIHSYIIRVIFWIDCLIQTGLFQRLQAGNQRILPRGCFWLETFWVQIWRIFWWNHPIFFWESKSVGICLCLLLFPPHFGYFPHHYENLPYFWYFPFHLHQLPRHQPIH